MSDILNKKQQLVVQYMMDVYHKRDVFVLRGSAGTGKTFALCKGILHLQQNHGVDVSTVCVAVPNHSVADLWRKNLVEFGLGEVQVKTVHSVMKLFPGVENDGSRPLVSFEELSQGKSILPFQLLVIDEAFMLNKQLIQTVYSHGYLGVIFAGDPDQTLPIGETISHLNEITDVAFDLTLDQNMRQKGQALRAIVAEVKEKALGYQPDLMNEGEFNRLFFKTAMSDQGNTLFLAYRNRTTKQMSNMLRSMEGVVDLDFVEVGEVIKVKSIMLGKKLIVPAESLVEVLSINPERNSFKIGFKSSTLEVMIDRKGAQEKLLIKAKLKNDKKTWAEYYKLCDSFVSFCHPCVSTVHSVQGQSVKNIFIDWKDLANCTQDPSLAYVAASRCSENIYFK
jgi:AAA domain